MDLFEKPGEVQRRKKFTFLARNDIDVSGVGQMMSNSILIADPVTVDLAPEPITREWVLSGKPEGSSRVLARSRDSTLTLVVWECTPGRFEWHYSKDEIVFVLSGEAIIVGAHGDERRFGTGDVVFFPAGSVCTWLVKERIRKVAVLKESLWRPLGMCVSMTARFRGLARAAVQKLRKSAAPLAASR
ncbi:MAG TPA: cupin domain-containing protein [Bryobacteraceae bacterium]|nr:cupin domain-containing protein [Bryobacteraceae bacterium]